MPAVRTIAKVAAPANRPYLGAPDFELMVGSVKQGCCVCENTHHQAPLDLFRPFEHISGFDSYDAAAEADKPCTATRIDGADPGRQRGVVPFRRRQDVRVRRSVHHYLPDGRGSEYLESMGREINVDDFRRRAQRRLPSIVFDYLDGGAEDEYCLRHNVEALRALRFLPKRLRDVTCPNCSIELFGRTCSAPFLIGPTGLNGVFWPNGDIALARAAAKASIPFVLSTPAQNSIEEVAERAGGELWFQLYDIDRKLSENLVERALRSGYKALVVTVDVPANGRRERDLRNRFVVPFHYSWKAIWDGLRHPFWLSQFLRQGMPVMANLVTKANSNAETATALARREMNAALSWQDLRDLRALWPHTLIVKGVLDTEDAILCAEAGANGLILSNHGGRQLDSVPSAIEVLPRISCACPAPLLVDGGFRRGADILKAIALGASAVLLGRAVLYGLAACGESGAGEVIGLLKEEIRRTLAQIGCASVCSLNREYLFNPGQSIP